MQPSMAEMHPSGESKTASFSLCRDSLEKNPSTAFIHEAGAGVKRNVQSGRPFSHSRTSADLCEETLSRTAWTGVPGSIPSAT